MLLTTFMILTNIQNALAHEWARSFIRNGEEWTGLKAGTGFLCLSCNERKNLPPTVYGQIECTTNCAYSTAWYNASGRGSYGRVTKKRCSHGPKNVSALAYKLYAFYLTHQQSYNSSEDTLLPPGPPLIGIEGFEQSELKITGFVVDTVNRKVKVYGISGYVETSDKNYTGKLSLQVWLPAHDSDTIATAGNKIWDGTATLSGGSSLSLSGDFQSSMFTQGSNDSAYRAGVTVDSLVFNFSHDNTDLSRVMLKVETDGWGNESACVAKTAAEDLPGLIESQKERDNSTINFEVYPNPTQEFLTIQAMGLENISAIEIYTINGEKVAAFDGLSKGSAVQKISLCHILAGKYFIVCSDEKNKRLGANSFIKTN